MGMWGGFMSQSIITPEIDELSALRTFSQQYEDKKKDCAIRMSPERLKTFIYNR